MFVSFSLSEWLSYLESLNIGRSDQGFAHVKAVARRLNLLPYQIPVITVTGTNGKGSCVAIISAMLQAANYQVGIYTSPHLFNYQERITVNNQFIDKQAICIAFNTIEQTRGELSLNYFQFSTLAALLLFKQLKVDIAVLEVGIGGRLDAVNIVDAQVAVISNVDLDHCEILGNSREKIALEKAAIMRRKKPLVYGDWDMPESLKQEVEIQQAELYRQGVDFTFQENKDSWHWQSAFKSYNNLPKLSLLLQNAATALMVVNVLPHVLVDESAVVTGLQNVYLPARCELLQQDKIFYLLDVAHNPQATNLLSKKIASIKNLNKKIAIVGMLGHKDIVNSLLPLVPYIDNWYTFTLADKRAARALQLTDCLLKLGAKQITIIENDGPGWQIVKNQLKAKDLVVIFGSFQTVAAAGQFMQISANLMEII